MTEGVIKFNCEWKETESSIEDIVEINKWRQKMFNLELIGVYADGIGYGNISARLPNEQFVITGSATGGIQDLTPEHYTTVTEFDIEKNYLKCEGPIRASSESLTHAAIYLADPSANAVVHVHNLELWNKLLDEVPTTPPQVEYGTSEMALEIIRLFKEDGVGKNIIVMAGHEEGVITFGKDLDQAGSILLNYLE